MLSWVFLWERILRAEKWWLKRSIDLCMSLNLYSLYFLRLEGKVVYFNHMAFELKKYLHSIDLIIIYQLSSQLLPFFTNWTVFQAGWGTLYKILKVFPCNAVSYYFCSASSVLLYKLGKKKCHDTIIFTFPACKKYQCKVEGAASKGCPPRSAKAVTWS